jgi:hypothetical protein
VNPDSSKVARGRGPSLAMSHEDEGYVLDLCVGHLNVDLKVRWRVGIYKGSTGVRFL